MNNYESNLGPVVCCDFCNEGEKSMGGVLISSYAVCGNCCEHKGIYEDNYSYKKDITELFDKNKTFRENVLAYRKKNTGTEDAHIKISTF